MKSKNLKRVLAFFFSLAVGVSAFCVPCSAAKAKVAAPKNVKASVVNGVSIKVSWQKVSGADGYIVYAKKYGAKDYKAVKTTGGRTYSYTYSNLSTNKKYYIKVRAFKRSGNNKIYSGYSAYKSVKTTVPCPNAPKISAVSIKDCDQLKVSWKKVSGANGYVLWAKESDGKFKKIATLGGKTYSYTHKKLKVNKKYFYKVQAFTNYGGKKYYGKYSAQTGKKTTNNLLSLAEPYVNNSFRIYNGSEYLLMAGEKYYSGIVTEGYGTYNVIYNLTGKQWKEISFSACYSGYYDEAIISIYSDDECVKSITLKNNDLPKNYTVYIDCPSKLEIKTSTYGCALANIKVSK